MHYRIPLRLAVAAVAFSPLSALAQEDPTVAPVVVTATRTAQTADESLASVSVITREDIERSQTSTLPELLGRIQGVEFVQNGGRGTASSLFIRGTNSDHIIVLIDGVRVGSATLGSTSFESLPLENIDRIEIVRGPRSSLYGSDAIGGVIQIFTRDSDGARANVAAGSHDYRRVSTGYGRQNDVGSFSVDFSAEDTDGFDARENDCSGCADEPDDDGFESTNLSLRGNYMLAPDLELSGNLLVADSEVEFDGNFQNSTEQRQTAGSIKLDWAATETWQSRFSLGRSSDKSDNFLDGTEVSNFDTVRTDISWQNDILIGDAQIVTAGVDVLRDEIDSNNDFEVTERETVGVFAQHQWSGARWNTQAGVRHDFFDEGFDDPNAGGDEFDDETTGSLAAGYRISEGLRVFGSLGTAFKAPTFNDLFFPGFGNPDLDPEQSETVEIGLRGDTEVINWEVTAYRTEVEDLIVTAEISPGVFAPENVDEARIQGVEIGVDAAWGKWQGGLNADFKDPEDTETGNQLRRRAKHTLRGSLTRSIGTWSIGTDVTIRGERFDDAANTKRLDSYALLDLRASWGFAPDWQASLKVNNAADTNYTLADTFNTDGRNLLVQVDWRPGSRR